MPRKHPRSSIDIDDVRRPWRHLVEVIGERRAGGEGEWKASQYIAEQFTAAGLENVRLEPFDCMSLRSASATIQVRDGAEWKKVPCEVLAGSPSTRPPDKPREMELAWVEMPEQITRLKKGSMKGKALGIFGPLATDSVGHAAIVASGASIVIWVDDRLPFEWAKADGIIPLWAGRHGVLPTVAVPYRKAYSWRMRGLDRIRACVETERVRATSHNVVAELPGKREDAGLVAIGCHHDTQVGNAGADDNASGVVAVIAMARALAKTAQEREFARTIRFIAFGAEEQLSVGSRAYVLNHQREMARHAFMINLDSIASALGHTEMLVAGTVELEKWARMALRDEDLLVRISYEVTPFSDHFPFTAMGVPALWFYRPNCAGGRWQHHSIHDTLANASAEAVATVAGGVCTLAARAASLKKLPFPRRFRSEQAGIIRKYAADLYGL
jgi:aminopeptidase YwaD